MVNVIFVLMESCSNLRGIAVRAVNTVVPVTEVTGCWIEIRGLEIGVLGHVCKLLTVIHQLEVVRALTVRAMAPGVENEFRVGVVGDGRLEFARTVTGIVVHLGQVLNELGLWF